MFKILEYPFHFGCHFGSFRYLKSFKQNQISSSSPYLPASCIWGVKKSPALLENGHYWERLFWCLSAVFLICTSSTIHHLSQKLSAGIGIQHFLCHPLYPTGLSHVLPGCPVFSNVPFSRPVTDNCCSLAYPACQPSVLMELETTAQLQRLS